MAHPFGPGQRGAAGRPVDRALARATGAMLGDAKAKVKRSQSVIVRIPNRAAAVVAVGGFTTTTVLSQAATAAAPPGSPAGARARQTTAVPGPLGQVAVFAHQARIAAQHLGHTSRHHLKEVVVEVVVEGHVEHQGDQGDGLGGLEPVEPLETLKILIETHQSPAVGDGQGCQIGVGAEPSRQRSVAQQLVKHIKAIVLWRSQAHPRLTAQRLQQRRGICRTHHRCAHQLRLLHQAKQAQGCDGAEQNTIGSLLLPVQQGLLVVTVIDA